jgi:hypothetical protein
MAYELMYSDDPEKDDMFTTKTDVWALGMTILEVRRQSGDSVDLRNLHYADPHG